jgi:hypothetical protein
MSVRFKSPKKITTYVPDRANKSQRELRRMAACITNQSQLESILLQTKAPMREGGFRLIAPFLLFKPLPDTIARVASYSSL